MKEMMTRSNAINLAYALMVVGTLLIVFADALAHQRLFSEPNVVVLTDTIVAWTTIIRYLGCACLFMGTIERLSQAIEYQKEVTET